MSGKSSKHNPYGSSTAPNGRGTVRVGNTPNLPAEAFNGQRGRRGAISGPATSAKSTIKRLANEIKRRQAALTRKKGREGRRGAITTIPLTNRLRLRTETRSRSKTPNRSYTAINVAGSPPSPIEVVVDPMHPPNNAIIDINGPSSRSKTPNDRIGVIVNDPAKHEVAIKIRSKSKRKNRRN